MNESSSAEAGLLFLLCQDNAHAPGATFYQPGKM